MSQEIPYLGSKISLLSKAEIRYEGTLYTIDPNEATVALAKVRSFGTEDRPTDRPLPARNEVFEFIIFRGHDIKDLHVCGPPKHSHDTGVPPDPAIVKSSQSAQPPPGPAGAAFPHGQPVGGGALGYQGSSAGGQGYQPFTQPLFVNQGQPAPGFAPHPGQAGGSQEEVTSAVDQTPEQLNHPSVSAIGTRHISGSQSSTPPLSRKSPTSDQGIQVQSRTPDKSGYEGHHQKQPSHHSHYSHHQQQQHHQHHHQHQHQQHHHHPRDFPRGHGVRHGGGGGGGGGQHRMDQRDRGDSRGDGRGHDPRGDRNVTSFVRGRGGGRGQPMREGSGAMRGSQGGHPRHRGRGGRSSEPLKFDTDFDFETSNAQFDKEDIEKELKNLTLTDKPVNGEKAEEDPEIEEEGEEEEDDDQVIYYDKKKSFFDNISCESTEKARGQRVTWREERKLNSETFGISENYRRNYRGRGGWRGGNQRGWRGRGRGGYRDNRDGGYNNRDGGYYGNRGGRGGRRPEWDYNDRRRMEGPQRVEVHS